MRSFLALLDLLSFVVLSTAKGLMLLQESHEQTFAYALEKISTAPIEDHVLDILELEEPPPVFTRRKRDDKITREVASQTSGVEDWSSADRIVSLSPKETNFSNGIVAVTFDCDDYPSNGAFYLIASQLRIFLPEEEELLFAKISIYRNETGALTFVDSTVATSQQKTVGFNITRMMSDWILGLSEPKLFIRIETGKDPYYLSNIQLESFIIASFLDEQIHIPQRTTRTRRSVEPIPEINVTERKTTRVHLVDPKRAEEAKCAPIQLSPAKILFIDNHGNVVMRRYQDMTVQECGCL
uniref:TGF_BETA_2 domain-containing protein n=1 Tax=Angiostrongylus cantonensis TaxID=6313 RepID=A0A0K0DEM0_ANGCA